jgi:hypothetical protein
MNLPVEAPTPAARQTAASADSGPDTAEGKLTAALDYGCRGWRVIPLHWVTPESKCSCGDPACGSVGKHPLTKHGLKDGTTDEATIRAWWGRWPNANVGVCTGPESGIFMLGPDGQAGIDALAGLERQNGPLPPTPRERSGSGGRHHVFAWPAEGTVPNRKNHLGLPIDIRGAGGYFVAAPSANGKGPYSWEASPEEVEPPQSPGWLLAWARDDGKAAQAPPPSAARHRPDVRERAVDYLEKCPAAVSHQGGHDQMFDVARAIVFGFDLGPDAGFDLLWCHYNPRCQPEWSEKELRHKCAEADTKPYGKPRGWLLNEDRPAAPRGQATRPAAPVFQLGPLTLRPGPPRRTALGKIVASVAVYRDAQRVDELPVNGSADGRKKAAKALAAHLGGDEDALKEAAAAVTKIIANAAEGLEAPQAAGGDTVKSVVADHVRQGLRPMYRTGKGELWCEGLGGPASRAAFCAYTTEPLVEAASAAADAPRDECGLVSRAAVVRAVELELKVLWATLLSTLPAAEGAGLGQHTEAGRQFRAAMVRLWTRPTTFNVDGRSDPYGNRNTTAVRASLLTRAMEQADKISLNERQQGTKWFSVHDAFSAWWRWHTDNGKTALWLAMRWHLTSAVGVDLPGVCDQGSLTALGKSFGVLCPNPPMCHHLSGARAARLAVLAPDLMEELIARPKDRPQAPAGGAQQQPGGGDQQQGPAGQQQGGGADDAQ